MKNKGFWRLIYSFVDFFLTKNSVPFFGTCSQKIRCFFARRISKGIQKKASIEKGAKIVPGVYMKPDACLGINCRTCPELYVGTRTIMGPNCCFFSTGHPRNTSGKIVFTNNYEKPKPIIVGDNCWIGYGCIIMGGVTIGEGSTVAAGSVVTHSIPPFCLVAGNPAVIKKKYPVPNGYYD